MFDKPSYLRKQRMEVLCHSMAAGLSILPPRGGWTPSALRELATAALSYAQAAVKSGGGELEVVSPRLSVPILRWSHSIVVATTGSPTDE